MATRVLLLLAYYNLLTARHSCLVSVAIQREFKPFIIRYSSKYLVIEN